MSTWTSPHSSVGISARRRSISASPVETIWITAAWPSPRSRSTDAINDGVFIAVMRWLKKRCLAHFERGPGGGLCLRVERAGCAGDVRRPHGRFEIVMDDREGAGIGIVDADLLVGQPVLDQFVLDALIGKRAGRIEAERLQIARQHFHRRDAAGLDRLDELAARRERESPRRPRARGAGRRRGYAPWWRRSPRHRRCARSAGHVAAEARRGPAATRPGRRVRPCRRPAFCIA